MSTEELKYEISSGNIFEDLEISNPDEYLKKAHLAFIIEDCITESGLGLEDAAKILNLSTTELSNLLDGLLDNFSVDDLSSLITTLKSLPNDPTTEHIGGFLQWLQQIFGQLRYSKVTWRKVAAVGFCVIAFLFLFGPRVYQNFSGERSAAATITPNAKHEKIAQIEIDRQIRSYNPASANKEDVIHLSLSVPTVVGDDESKQLAKRSR